MNGFPHAQIHYARSHYDIDHNRIHLIFAIDEGAPVIVSDIRYLAADGSKFQDPAGGKRRMLDDITMRVGDRYSEFQQVRTRDQALAWLKDHGYAFAAVRDSASIDLTANTAAVQFTIVPGPRGTFSQIEIEGNESVSDRVILRELPFKSGQRFSNTKLSQGQRELFALNLFRTALTEVPDQPADSTVDIRIRLREARPRLITYQLGYGRESGLNLRGDWTHRNFFGDARSFSTGLVANTGFQAASTDRVSPRLFRGSLSMRQPYLFSTKLSGTLSLFLQYRRDPQLPESGEVLGINEREMGLDASLLYELLPFRTVSVQYTWSRALQLSGAEGVDLPSRDIFNRGNVIVSAVLGKTTDYIRGGTGFLVRPFVETAQPALGSDVRYVKLGGELTGFRDLLPRLGLAGRLFVGRLWPQGASRNQDDPRIENRFDQIRFYTGGASDLRGWASQLAGPKVVRTDVSAGDTTYVYEAIGGLAKLSAMLEVRLPFPGLGEDWGTAAFIGAGKVSQGNLSRGDFRFGTGIGIRYATPVGLIRLDLAYKLNPDEADLRRAADYYARGVDAPTRWGRRFAVHLSIGQTF
jgi:outer membrane protein insertion porin family